MQEVFRLVTIHTTYTTVAVNRLLVRVRIRIVGEMIVRVEGMVRVGTMNSVVGGDSGTSVHVVGRIGSVVCVAIAITGARSGRVVNICTQCRHINTVMLRVVITTRAVAIHIRYHGFVATVANTRLSAAVREA